jgi:hypothetical protein
MPGGAGSEFVTLDQQGVSDTECGQVVQATAADNTATDDHHPCMFRHVCLRLQKL